MIIMDEDYIIAAVEASKSFNEFRQHIMHIQNKVTDTDKAIHARNLVRAKKIREGSKTYQFHPNVHKASFLEDEFKEFRGEPE